MERKTVEQHAAADKTPAWLFAACKQFFHWAIGQEMTAAQFLEAKLHVLNDVRSGY